jgi:hypothetical protein
MKRVLSIQDISCIGKCSLTVALPIISAMGIETSILPTSILSTHTMFNDFTFRDLTDDMEPIKKHWQKEGFSFDAIYTGYLGSEKQITLVKDYFKTFGNTCKYNAGNNIDLCKAPVHPTNNGFTKVENAVCNAAFIHDIGSKNKIGNRNQRIAVGTFLD